MLIIAPSSELLLDYICVHWLHCYCIVAVVVIGTPKQGTCPTRGTQCITG